ncbi:hypothetical protein GF362_03345 [Candidatus Dojkabacteria bacterium]|nr:hypothetical protein [Candidatus Dojkabacteria bacterium]
MDIIFNQDIMQEGDQNAFNMRLRDLSNTGCATSDLVQRFCGIKIDDMLSWDSDFACTKPQGATCNACPVFKGYIPDSLRNLKKGQPTWNWVYPLTEA